MPFVVDNSVTVAWCFVEEGTPYTEGIHDRLRETHALVPAIWPLELRNVLLVAERRRRITQADTVSFLQVLDGLSIILDMAALTDSLNAVVALGRQHGLTAYDACYLELAMRHGLPLATQDA